MGWRTVPNAVKQERERAGITGKTPGHVAVVITISGAQLTRVQMSMIYIGNETLAEIHSWLLKQWRRKN